MTNNPETYDCRTALKNCFSVISECRRVAIRRLPVNFFVVMFDDLTQALVNNENLYADIVIQAWETRNLRNYQVDPQFVNATMNIFETTLKKFDINDSTVSKVYREFLTKKGYILKYVYYALANLKHLQ